ncbi:hypothetical protein C7S20_09720 [Christiangramia fulva]|uniref:Phosphatidic acid phosphatase type 2/haloperoxidase domain-containing protein n=2 Tax=Christiangramia fulva TaxID=2126553 RepID=A0A2R3Z5H6_9FLAO|nr:hypothetical protein C7S20_09720 [Christiangramia fulva]
MLAILIGIFLIFTLIVIIVPTSILDVEFSEEIQEHNSPLLDTFMKAISWFGVTPVALCFVFGSALIFFLFRYRKEALFIISTLTVTLVTFGIKLLINRPRPTADLVNIVEHAQHQSFPSGHTSFYVTFFGFITFLMLRHPQIPREIRAAIISLCVFLILSVPFSRIYLGAHWFTDVGAGFVLGVLVLYAIIRIYLYYKRRSGPEPE